MSTISSEEIISILKEKIENYDAMCQEQETGKVISVGDGIATIYGIDHAMYGEIVTFENGEKGMVQDIRQDTIGCILSHMWTVSYRSTVSGTSVRLILRSFPAGCGSALP